MKKLIAALFGLLLATQAHAQGTFLGVNPIFGQSFNNLQISGSTTGNPVNIAPLGGDANLGLNLSALGTGAVKLLGNGNAAFAAQNTSASAVNFLQASGSITLNPVILGAVGNDTNIQVNISGKGTGSITLVSNGNNAFVAQNTSASAVNWLIANGSATGVALSIVPATGGSTDTNVEVDIASKGNKAVNISNNGHLYGGGTAPTASACAGFALGTGSSDLGGRVTFTSATSCAISFGTAYTNAPFCTVVPGSAASTVSVTTSTTVLTATFGTANTAMQYHCIGN